MTWVRPRSPSLTKIGEQGLNHTQGGIDIQPCPFPVVLIIRDGYYAIIKGQGAFTDLYTVFNQFITVIVGFERSEIVMVGETNLIAGLLEPYRLVDIPMA